jgi:hypothetical protein
VTAPWSRRRPSDRPVIATAIAIVVITAGTVARVGAIVIIAIVVALTVVSPPTTRLIVIVVIVIAVAGNVVSSSSTRPGSSRGGQCGSNVWLLTYCPGACARNGHSVSKSGRRGSDVNYELV